MSSSEPRDPETANNMLVPGERSAVCAFASEALEAKRLGLLVKETWLGYGGHEEPCLHALYGHRVCLFGQQSKSSPM